MAGARARIVDRALLALLATYVALVALSAFLDRDLGVLHPATLSSSPVGVANGQVVRLVTSGLVVDGRLAALQIAGLVVVAVAVVEREGIRAWWGSALAGHVGSALLAYAFIAIALGIGATTAGRVDERPDFGISCVFAGTLGALFAGSLRRLSRRRTPGELAVAGGCLLLVLGLIPASLGWYGIEHPLAFALGAGFMAWWGRRERQ